MLTTPIIRCLSQQLPGSEIHFVIKKSFEATLKNNPYLSKLHTFEKDVNEIYKNLKREDFDFIIDLHNNLRSTRLKLYLKKPSHTFKKLNFKKFLAVTFKKINALPDLHIVDRYFEPIEKLGLKKDEGGLDYFISKEDEINCEDVFFNKTKTNFVALVLGGSYFTKQIPVNKLIEICTQLKQPVVLFGGKDEIEVGNLLEKKFEHVRNACGKFSLNQSASIIKQSDLVITSDTGLMHIASAYNKIIYSVWGNTIPEFGMSPYKPNSENKILETKNLSCRPCSKLGHHSCPKKHFNCMNEINFKFLEEI